jgi:hypothetical protein
MNQVLSSNNKSGTKGVSFQKFKNKWRAIVVVLGKSIHLGYFDTKEEATIVRQTKAIELFKEFACEI